MFKSSSCHSRSGHHAVRNWIWTSVRARLACKNSYTCQAAGLHPISLHNDKQDNNVRNLHRPLCETLQQCVKLHQHTMTSIAIVAGTYHNSQASNQTWRLYGFRSGLRPGCFNCFNGFKSHNLCHMDSIRMTFLLKSWSDMSIRCYQAVRTCARTHIHTCLRDFQRS